MNDQVQLLQTTFKSGNKVAHSADRNNHRLGLNIQNQTEDREPFQQQLISINACDRKIQPSQAKPPV